MVGAGTAEYAEGSVAGIGMGLTTEDAKAFGEKHCAVWNTHDLDAISAINTDDVDLASPLAADLTGGGAVARRAALPEDSRRD